MFRFVTIIDWCEPGCKLFESGRCRVAKKAYFVGSIKVHPVTMGRQAGITEVKRCFSAVEVAGAWTDRGENGKALAEPVLSGTGSERLGNGKRQWPTGDLPLV